MRYLHCEHTRLFAPSAETDILSGGTKSTDKRRAENLVGPCATCSRGNTLTWLTPAGQWARPEHRRPQAPAPGPNGKRTTLRQVEPPPSLRQRRKRSKTGLR